MAIKSFEIHSAGPILRLFRKVGGPLSRGGLLRTFLVLLVVFSAVRLVQAESPQIPVVRVGSLLALSGGLEQWCAYVKKGAELAASEQGDVRVEITYEDDRSANKSATITAAKKLIDLDRVDVVTSWTLSTTPILTPIANRSKVPLIIGGYDSVVHAAGPWVFGGFVYQEEAAREIARMFVRDRGARRIGLLMAADDWSQSYEQPFSDEVRKLGGQIILREVLPPTETDLRGVVTRLRQRGVDAVLAPLFGEPLFSLLKRRTELGYTGMISVGDGMFEDDLKTAGASAEGIYANQIVVDSAELKAKLKTKFGEEGNFLQLGMAATGYDLINHLKAIARDLHARNVPINRESLQKALRTFESQGYGGTQMYGAPPRYAGEEVMIVRGGRFQRVN